MRNEDSILFVSPGYLYLLYIMFFRNYFKAWLMMEVSNSMAGRFFRVGGVRLF